MLLVNGVFIKNSRQINIESGHILKVEVEKVADFDELKNVYPLLSIVNIKRKIMLNLMEKGSNIR